MKYHYSHRHRIYIYEPFIDQTIISSLYPKIFLEPVYVRTTISQTKGRGVEYMYLKGGFLWRRDRQYLKSIHFWHSRVSLRYYLFLGITQEAIVQDCLSKQTAAGIEIFHLGPQRII